MDSRDLQIFLSVARTGSTLGASKRLSVSQSTVSRRIEALESELELTLFDKLPSVYELTDAGRSLLPEAEEVERALAKVVASAKEQKRGLAGPIRFTTLELFGQTFLAEAMVEFRAAYPDIQVDIVLAESVLDLVAGEADVAVRAGRAPSDPGLVARRIGRDGWSVYCSRAYAERFGAPRAAEDLERHRVIALVKEFPRFPLFAWFDSVVPDSAVLVRHHNVPGLFTGLRGGLGVSMMSDLVASTEPDLIKCFAPPPEVESANDLWLVTTERLRGEPRIRALMDFFAGYFATAKYKGAPQD
ncbi:MAG TPA: LysR family transcriptional regulator [Polyangiaceae bacterium]|nr:LysR family transcriptional regulator [Polyangiaceae bacterium]